MIKIGYNISAISAIAVLIGEALDCCFNRGTAETHDEWKTKMLMLQNNVSTL